MGRKTMTDIVERLRELAHEYHQHRPYYTEAAHEIERLRKEMHVAYLQAAEINRLRALIDQLRSKQEREYDPDVAPCDDAEFGMKP